MGVQADDVALGMFLVRDEPLDHVGILVRHHQLDRVREVQNDFFLGGRAPRIGDGLADFSAKSTSVPEKLSGEYSKRMWVPGTVLMRSLICFVPRTAMSSTPFLSRPKAMRRCAVEVEL